MKDETIKRNTPIHPRKAAFYKNLVAYFNATIANMEQNAGIKEVVDKITELENGRHINVAFGRITTLNKRMVYDLTPIHPRKAALYKCLVRYLELSLRPAEIKDRFADDADFGDDDVKVYVGKVHAILVSVGAPVDVLFDISGNEADDDDDVVDVFVVKPAAAKTAPKPAAPAKKKVKVLVKRIMQQYVEVEVDGDSDEDTIKAAALRGCDTNAWVDLGNLEYEIG